MEEKKRGRGVRDGMFCLQALHHRKRMRMLGGREDSGVGGDGAVCGGGGEHEEEIQLNYTRTECIFNHNASFPDVTVSLCE